MPVRDSFPGGLTLGELGLKPVRTELFLGFVWVAVTGDPAPLARGVGAVRRGFCAL
ncbi:MAG: hypothetical protein WDN69_16215 [Aliidongia sp.]